DRNLISARSASGQTASLPPYTSGTVALLTLLGPWSRRGGPTMSLALYLAEGIVGLPFFAGGAHGLSVVVGATGGYLIGFIAAAYIIGLLAERGLERNARTSFIPFLVGTTIIYAFGITGLSILLGSFSKAIALGMVPFLIGDVIKLLAAAVALPAAWKIVK
ncbi:MAG TPA: biotin transporter BioY, partial [Anaerolineales bacterium]|nr:biotin transporter BioY [Anaerolineales bacterium]